MKNMKIAMPSAPAVRPGQWSDRYGWRRFGLGGVLFLAVLPRVFAADPTSGRVVAWGGNANNLTNVPAGLTDITAVAAGAVHNLALKREGTVVAWGYSGHDETNVPAGLNQVVAIAASGYLANGYDHNLALKRDGTVVTWGSPDTVPDIFKPVGLSNVAAIATGPAHSMALLSNQTVVVWGASASLTAVPPDLTNAVAIAAGGFHCLALRKNGTVTAWGSNSAGQTNVPAGLNNVMAVAAGNLHSLALQSNGTVIAWGNNYFGQTNVPAGLTNVIAISASGNEYGNHNLALKSDGTLVEWGQVFNGPVSGFYETPPGDLSNVVSVAVGSSDSLAVTAGLTIKSVGIASQGPTLRFHTFSGRQYAVEFSSLPATNGWTNLPGGGFSGSGYDLVVTDTNAAGMPCRFYRVRQN